MVPGGGGRQSTSGLTGEVPHCPVIASSTPAGVELAMTVDAISPVSLTARLVNLGASEVTRRDDSFVQDIDAAG